MCFYSAVSADAVTIENRFKAKFELKYEFKPSTFLNGFAHPKMPVITGHNPQSIQLMEWGLLPAWAKDRSLQKSGLNARSETLNEKPMFRQVAKNHCLVIATGFYEWKWLDEKGKKKEKFFVKPVGTDLFAFAGIWSEWVDKTTGECVKTFAVLTTEAQGLMREIHNSKLRMPIVLNPEQEVEWLKNEPVSFEPVLWEAVSEKAENY